MATLEQIKAKMAKLQAQAEALAAKKSAMVLKTIYEIMKKHGLTTADIDAHVGGKKRGPRPGAKATNAKAKATVKTKGSLPPKYRDPKTGATWSGHARPPLWIAGAKDRTKFLIADDAEATAATSAGTESKAKTTGRNTSSKSAGASASAGKGQRKGPQAAKYADPKSGATWSGRGRAPAWLAGAKDRSRFLIDGAAAVGGAKPAVTKAVAKKAPTAKKAVAKKAVGAKVPAKKAPAKESGRKSAAVPAPVPTVESGAELTT
ncbi:DNA-binding protein H-NS [Paraburkholderia sp. RAU6.4a]|uniref:H-NS family nucleoid-associated regulatory protein n=1 Tax=Paraburkholderia sp. RAU6.4a TaxID=2991067 RepID=UPI003D253C0E